MKRVLIITILNLIIFSNIVKASELFFLDMDEHWAKENVIKLTEKGFVSGYSDNTFKPENKITTMEFLKVLIEAGEYKLIRKGDSIYPDFYYETALDRGLISKEIDVNKNMTRYEMLEIISKFINLENVREAKNKFKDLKNEYKTIVLKFVDLKIINGYKDKYRRIIFGH